MEKQYRFFYGVPLSDWDRENKCVSFATLNRAVHNICTECSLQELYELDPDIEVYHGSWWTNEDGDFVEDEGQDNLHEYEVMNIRLVDDDGLDALKQADQLILYSPKLGTYIWCIGFCGVSWAEYGTKIKLNDDGYVVAFYGE